MKALTDDSGKPTCNVRKLTFCLGFAADSSGFNCLCFRLCQTLTPFIFLCFVFFFVLPHQIMSQIAAAFFFFMRLFPFDCLTSDKSFSLFFSFLFLSTHFLNCLKGPHMMLFYLVQFCSNVILYWGKLNNQIIWNRSSTTRELFYTDCDSKTPCPVLPGGKCRIIIPKTQSYHSFFFPILLFLLACIENGETGNEGRE